EDIVAPREGEAEEGGADEVVGVRLPRCRGGELQVIDARHGRHVADPVGGGGPVAVERAAAVPDAGRGRHAFLQHFEPEPAAIPPALLGGASAAARPLATGAAEAK